MDAVAIIQFAVETEDTAVDLGGLQLTSVPPEITQLTAVSHLSLRGNQLTSLPPEIGQLTNLRQLSLANNQLTSLPPEIGRLTQLTHLNLRHNQLTQLPAEITALNSLEMLQLQDNPLSLPEEILAKWNQPSAILDYYRAQFHTPATDNSPTPNTLLWVLSDFLTPRAFAQICADLTLPPGTIPADAPRVEQAQALLDFHERHDMADEFAALVRIMQETHRASYEWEQN